MRTQRKPVRTQRVMVYKYKCALNESALNEVRTQRGFAVVLLLWKQLWELQSLEKLQN